MKPTPPSRPQRAFMRGFGAALAQWLPEPELVARALDALGIYTTREARWRGMATGDVRSLSRLGAFTAASIIDSKRRIAVLKFKLREMRS